MRYGVVLRSRAVLLPATVVAAVLLLSGCSSGPSPTPGGSTTPAPTPTSASPSRTSDGPTPTPPSSATPTPTATARPTPTGFASGTVTGGTERTGPDQARLVRVAVGQHARYDRLVLEFADGPVPAYEVATQPDPVFHRDASDAEVVLAGESGVRVVVRGTVVSATAPQTLTPKYRAVREVERIGDFEAVVSYGVGVAGSAKVRVTTLSSPARLVIDVLAP